MNGAAKIIEGFFVRNRDRFGYIQLLMFIAFVILILIPVFLPLPKEEDVIWSNFPLMARFIVWGIWFPLIFVSVIFFGRIWCGVFCPQGALSEYAGNKGLNKPIPKWMRWQGMPIISFVFITILAQVVGARDYALPALEVFGGTMILAIIIGFLYTSSPRTTFDKASNILKSKAVSNSLQLCNTISPSKVVRGKRRAWCRFLCPIGPLLGIFSRLGAVSFEKNSGDGKGCICPTFINTSNKTASSNCIECFRCVSSDAAHSLHLKIRRPGIEIEEIKNRESNIWEVVFLFSATGLALGAFHWQANPLYIQYKQAIGSLLLNLGLGDLIGKSGTWWFMVNYPAAGEVFNYLDFISITTFMLISMILVAVVLFVLTAASAIILNDKGAIVTTITRLGYLYAPAALVSLVIGLGLILFQSLGAFGLSKEVIKVIQLTLFAGSGMWSIYLAIKLQEGLSLAIIPNTIGIGFIVFLWHRVLV